MAKAQTTLEAVKTKMQELKDARQAQFDTIRKMQETYSEQIRTADMTMKRATAELDLDTYETARQAKRKAQAGQEMYTKRQKELEAQEIISEPESDRIINGLLEYEEHLAADFRRAIEEPLRKLEQILAEYTAAVADTENTIHEWTRDIHANYSTRGRSLRTDPATGQTTDRSETPLPVHIMKYTGCPEAAQLELYLQKAKSNKIAF